MTGSRKEPSFSTGAVDEATMTALAEALAGVIEPPLTIYLEGDLGAGKTTFARAFIRSLGHRGSVKSPTYGLLEDYPLGALHVVHLDLYRVEQSGELEFLGLADLLDDKAIFMIEWPERGRGFLPVADLVISFSHSGDLRALEFTAMNRHVSTFFSLLSKFSN